jgi:UDP-N-acetylmuramoyl-L-alanyl-D-glutamate--2,6-diaminopimelate ligase
VLVAGKGHETYQEGANGRVAFDDRVVCRRALGGR